MPQTISPGTRLGPYEIQSLVGAGGMGEVYRARDSRLDRDVAIKVLPRALAEDEDRLRRFEIEARAAGQLNHPNVVAVHDIGWTGAKGSGLPYIVSEMLEGSDLRASLISGPIPPRRSVEYAIQIARGLAAAHARGIVHRDLKPENVMILPGNHVKILDFGLAKLVHVERMAGDDTGPLASTLAGTGAILGTPSYMSPEQIRDRPTDHRTDIFALGALVYEMLTGRRAFDGESHADRMTAILKSEPPPLPTEIEEALPGIGAIIAHCLEKSPADRFDSASDLAFALSLTVVRAGALASRAPGTVLDTATSGRDLSHHSIAFRDGTIYGARFAPDGTSVCYGAALDGGPVELFWYYAGNPESRALGYSRADLLSIAHTGEMAVSLRRKTLGGFLATGMLARMPMGGGAPKEILDGVWEADFHPDGPALRSRETKEGWRVLSFPRG